MHELRFTLPLPCRTNARTRSRPGGTYTPKDAQDELDKCVAAVQELARELGTFHCAFTVSGTFYHGSRGPDFDAYHKATWDCLQYGGLILDDKQICGIGPGQLPTELDARNPRSELVLTETRDPVLLERWSAAMARAAKKSPEHLEAAQSQWAAKEREKTRLAALKDLIRGANRKRRKNPGRRSAPGGRKAAS